MVKYPVMKVVFRTLLKYSVIRLIHSVGIREIVSDIADAVSIQSRYSEKHLRTLYSNNFYLCNVLQKSLLCQGTMSFKTARIWMMHGDGG